VTQIGLIRHGITDWNMQRRVQGMTDISLNDTGRQQAHALAERLKAEQWDIMYASDLSRAVETAEIVGRALDLPVQTDQRLREMYCGEIEGTTLEDRISRWGSEWESLSLGIEDEQSISGRGVSFVADISVHYPNKKVLVVSHGALVAYTLRRLIPYVNTEEHIQNTSITKLRFSNGQWECDLFNCAKHLIEII
jgi:probable phosphoglycerate mutase